MYTRLAELGVRVLALTYKQFRDGDATTQTRECVAIEPPSHHGHRGRCTHRQLHCTAMHRSVMKTVVDGDQTITGINEGKLVAGDTTPLVVVKVPVIHIHNKISFGSVSLG